MGEQDQFSKLFDLITDMRMSIENKMDKIISEHNALKTDVTVLQAAHEYQGGSHEKALGELQNRICRLEMDLVVHSSLDAGAKTTKTETFGKTTWAIGLAFGIITLVVTVIVQIILG